VPAEGCAPSLQQSSIPVTHMQANNNQQVNVARQAKRIAQLTTPTKAGQLADKENTVQISSPDKRSRAGNRGFCDEVYVDGNKRIMKLHDNAILVFGVSRLSDEILCLVNQLIGITLPLWSNEDSAAGGKVRPCNHYLMLHACVGTNRKSYW
jgi:hypothetical protein